MHSSRATDPAAGVGDNSEADLIQRCLEGDATAWDTLVRVYWKRVFNIAYKFVAQFDEAEDLTQEILVKLFRALPTFDRRASFETWLTSVSRNLCIDRYRRRRREEERFTDEVDPDTIQLDELVSRPDATLEQRDEIAMVRRALLGHARCGRARSKARCLPARRCRALRLPRGHGFSRQVIRRLRANARCGRIPGP
jgi:RNA polymerase sigma factor (sigma-70 family)